MKKILFMSLAVVLILSFLGCESNSDKATRSH